MNLKRAIEEIQLDSETKSSLETFDSLNFDLRQHFHEIQKQVCNPTNCLKFMQPGRLVKIVIGELDYGYGVVVDFERKKEKYCRPQYFLEVLLRVANKMKCMEEGIKGPITPVPAVDGESSELVLSTVALHAVNSISSIRLLYLPKELKQPESRLAVLKSLSDILRCYPEDLPLLDPVVDMGISDDSMVQAICRSKKLNHKIQKHSINNYHPTEKQLLIDKFKLKKMLEHRMEEMMLKYKREGADFTN